MRKRDPSHATAVAVRITAGTDHKMLRHHTIVKANAERSTSNAQDRIDNTRNKKNRKPDCISLPAFLSDSVFCREGIILSHSSAEERATNATTGVFDSSTLNISFCAYALEHKQEQRLDRRRRAQRTCSNTFLESFL